MASFIVCPDGTTYTLGRLTPTEAGGRAVDADTAEEALHVAYADGDALFPPMPHYDGVTDPAAWSAVRDGRILAAARRVILDGGLKGLTRKAIAGGANMSPATISNYGRANLKQTEKPVGGYRDRILAGLMADAIDKADIAIIRAGIADGCLRGDDVPSGLRAAAGV